jgi:hypothetical protein
VGSEVDLKNWQIYWITPEELAMNQHLGSNFDDFLAEEGILAETQAAAWKRVIAYQIAQLIAKKVIRPLPYVNSESNLS